MVTPERLPQWAVLIDQATRDARTQVHAAILSGRAYTTTEARWMLQWAEDLEGVARMLRAGAAGVDK
jgi:hypothetical protein